ncbi:hypothetical protein E2C01_044700 [Portunus trituberculatus]|uniref:Uncharacterized protein n=1 Tax=Portunus trituberculatus TaxID=210409 RepID=A0A5B7FZ23_PORTR|nr:hypothetical protein [Portunus trituberculatus]
MPRKLFNALWLQQKPVVAKEAVREPLPGLRPKSNQKLGASRNTRIPQVKERPHAIPSAYALHGSPQGQEDLARPPLVTLYICTSSSSQTPGRRRPWEDRRKVFR